MMLCASANSLKSLSTLSIFGTSAALSLTACFLRSKENTQMSHTTASKLALYQFRTETLEIVWYTTLPFVVDFFS